MRAPTATIRIGCPCDAKFTCMFGDLFVLSWRVLLDFYILIPTEDQHSFLLGEKRENSDDRTTTTRP